MIQFKVKEYSIIASTSFKEVEKEWNQINSNTILTSTDLLPIEQSKIMDVTPYYLLVSKNQKLVGIIYYQMLHFNSSFIDLGILNKWYYNILQFFIRRIKTNLLRYYNHLP